MKTETMVEAMKQIAIYLPTSIADNFECHSKCETKQVMIHSLLCHHGVLSTNNHETVICRGRNGERLDVRVFDSDPKYESVLVEYTNKAGFRISIESPFL